MATMSQDKQVQEAFYHWMPRFMANQVDYNDLQRIKARLESLGRLVPGLVGDGGET